MHFSNNKIIHNANQLGVSLGSNDVEVAKSVNDLLDLEAERALEMIRNLAAVKPMNDSDVDALGVNVLDSFCADLASSLPENEEDEYSTSPSDSIIAESQVEVPTELGCGERVEDQNRPKRKWNCRIYPASAVRRSARIRTAKKFHHEI